MFRKLKIKSIVLALVSLLVLLVSIMSCMAIITHNTVEKNADATISEILQDETLLAANDDVPPDLEKDTAPNKGDEIPEIKEKAAPRGKSNKGPVFGHRDITDSDFIILTVESDGTTSYKKYGNISRVTDDNIERFKTRALGEKSKKGYVRGFRFNVVEQQGETKIVFLECSREIQSHVSSVLVGWMVALVAYVVVSVVLIFLAGRIIRPIAESYEKQKRFVTNAGHEIRTPLTIINANADVLEMELGEENEAVRDIKTQTRRLASLTEDLIYLSRIEEQENKLSKIDIPLSDIVEEVVQSFRALAEEKNITVDAQITPMLTLNGDAKSIEKLIGNLMSNAVKYSPENGTVSVSLTKDGKQIVLKISNPTIWQVNKEKLAYVFDRFYRSDSSRNSQTGGHGIGLSVAKAIVTAHSGKIKATTTDGNDFIITVLL